MKEATEAGMTSLLMKQLAEQPETYPCAFLYGSDEKAEQCAEQFLRCISACRPSASTCLTDAEALWGDIFPNCAAAMYRLFLNSIRTAMC